MNAPMEAVSKADVERVFELQSTRQWSIRKSSIDERIERLKKLRDALKQNEEAV